VVATLPVIFVGSFGPACWWVVLQPRLKTPVANAYWPVMRAARAAHVRSYFHAYGDFGTRSVKDRQIVTEIVRFNF